MTIYRPFYPLESGKTKKKKNLDKVKEKGCREF
jgi:hypothetical protein